MKVWGLLFSLLLIPIAVSAQDDSAKIGVDPEKNHAMEADDTFSADSAVLANPMGVYEKSVSFTRDGDNDESPKTPFQNRGAAKSNGSASGSGGSDTATE